MNHRATPRLILIPLLIVVTSCSATKGKQLAESAVNRFHNHLNAGEFASIYAESDEAFKTWGAEANLTDLLSTVHRKLGVVQDARETGWNVNATTNGTFVTLRYDVDFSQAKGTEEFVFLIRGDKALLFRFNINSPTLFTS